jgi:hypothetical protein
MGYNLFRLRTWLRLTGGAPARSGKDPLAHILYLRRADPERYRAAHKFLEPKDYLNLRLTGRFASTYETLTLHWLTDNRDIRRVDYHPTLLRYAGLRREQFPDLYPSTAFRRTSRSAPPRGSVAMCRSSAQTSGAILRRCLRAFQGATSSRTSRSRRARV